MKKEEYIQRVKERLVANSIEESVADLIIEHWSDKVNVSAEMNYPTPEETADFIQNWTLSVKGKIVRNTNW